MRGPSNRRLTRTESAITRSGMIGYVAEGMHEAHVALMLRDSHVRRVWSLQTRFKGDCASPVGCALELEPEPAPFMKLACHSSPWTMETRDHDKPFPDSQPVISAGTARFDTGPPDKAYGRVHARIVGAWAVVIICAWEGDIWLRVARW